MHTLLQPRFTFSRLQLLRSDACPRPRVVRVMPNTPCAIGEAATTACKGTYATEDDLELAMAIFNPLGEILKIPESQMDGTLNL